MRHFFRNRTILAFAGICTAGILAAQYPSQIPGIPIPRIPIPRRGSGKTNPADKKPSDKEILEQFRGTIRGIDAESVSIDASDSRIVNFKCGKATKVVRKEDEEIRLSALKPGDEVAIEARKDENGFFYAVNVRLEKEAPGPRPPAPVETAEQKPAPGKPAKPAEVEEETGPAATILRPPEADPNQDPPPTLRRGKPAPKPARQSDESEQVASAAPPARAAAPVAAPVSAPVPAEDQPVPAKPESFIDKARRNAGEFTEQLPNYICNQMTTRYQSEGRPAQWQPLDVVTAAVVYENGQESYHNIKINNKAVNKKMEEMPGSWSRGEFGATLADLFSPATAGDFRLRGDSTASGLAASTYSFQVERPNSHWETRIGGQSIFPAYKGTVWIDKKSVRVLRIEMQARNIPEEFPLDSVEWVVDYSFVRIGTGQFLLPVHAENLSCWRGTSQCARNAIDFRNYRKFTSESQIMATDSTVSFEGEEKPPAKPAPDKKK